eukprot:6208950-Pleurochrysis_carterae.AAC.1
MKQYKRVSTCKIYEMNVKVKSQSSAFCELRHRDRRSTKIAISGDSYLEPTPSTLGAIAKYPASRSIDSISHRKYNQYFL